MQFAQCLCVLLIVAVLVPFIDAKSRKTFSTRRKSGGNRRTSSQHKPPPQPQPSTPHRTDSSTSFLNSERAGSSHGSVNTHHRDPFSNNQPQTPKQTVPQTNGPIGFEGLNKQGNKNLGFDKVNSEVQRKPAVSNVPSAPAYPAGSPSYPGGASYPGKPVAGAPNGPPPAYPGYGSASGSPAGGGYVAPPAYPGRPVNAPPVYSANNPTFGQTNVNQPGFGGYSHQQGSFPGQQGSFPGQNHYGQNNFGYPNTGGNFGNYPNQGYSSYPSGGFGQSNHGGFGGNPYGGSPFGQSNSFGGSPYGSQGFGGNSFGGGNHYSPNNFGYSNNPGLFGSHSSYGGGYGQNNNFGYHKKSRFGGLPIPIPIPIPIPMGMFGGFGGFGGGRSHKHRELDTFIKNQTVNTSDNATTSVFILNNSTITPCTTDQFIYDSLNVTVMSCTAGNCTAVKIVVTTYVSKEASSYSAGLTMCLEPNPTYTTFSNNVNPTVSDLHKYWMQVCREIIPANVTLNATESAGNITINATESAVSNFTVKITEVVLNETVINEGNITTNASESESTSTIPDLESTSVLPTTETSTSLPLNLTEPTTIFDNSTASVNSSDSINVTNTINSTCELFDCSWIELCLPSIEIVDRRTTPDSPFTKTGYRPCLKIKMCQSPSTPISTFATLNNTISRIDQYNNVTTSVNDVANLTLISYIPPTMPANCSQDATDLACQPPPVLPPQDCVPSNSTDSPAVGDLSSSPTNNTVCKPAMAELNRSKRSIELLRNPVVEDLNLDNFEI